VVSDSTPRWQTAWRPCPREQAADLFDAWHEWARSAAVVARAPGELRVFWNYNFPVVGGMTRPGDMWPYLLPSLLLYAHRVVTSTTLPYALEQLHDHGSSAMLASALHWLADYRQLMEDGTVVVLPPHPNPGRNTATRAGYPTGHRGHALDNGDRTRPAERNEEISTPVLAERDRVIDGLYAEIEELVNRQILLQAPVASDLRFLLSVLRIVPELERSHDLVVEIAHLAGHILSEDLSPRSQGLIERMGNLASGMWRQAADAWNERDRSAAFTLGERVIEMDDLHASLVAELASGQMALPVTMEMTLVARLYKRLGAHAANIARRVVYLAGSAAG
jgi:phosphate transport system protein